MRYLIALFAALALCFPTVAPAQMAPTRVVRAKDGTLKDADAMICVDLTGAYVGCGGAGGGGSVPTGTAGSPNASVVTVQGITNGTPQNVQQLDVQGSCTVSATTIGNTCQLFTGNSNGAGTLTFQLASVAGGLVLTPEISFDGTNYTTSAAIFLNGTSTSSAPTISANGRYRMTATGVRGMRLTVSTAGTGSATATTNLTTAPSDPLSANLDSNRDLRIQTPTITEGSAVSLSANTSTQIATANTARIGVEIQCDGSAAVGLSILGTTLTGNTLTGAPRVLPAGSTPMYIPLYGSKTAITAYSTTAQTCRVTQYAQQ